MRCPTKKTLYYLKKKKRRILIFACYIGAIYNRGSCELRLWNRTMVDFPLSDHSLYSCDTRVFCLLQADEEKVISGSYDSTLKVWCVKTGRCLRTLTGHQGRVLTIFFDKFDGTLISGSDDCTIKVRQLFLFLNTTRWSSKHSSDWARCQKAVGGICFTKKWKAETLQPGLDFDIFKPRLQSCILKCISWLTVSFFGVWWSWVYERGSQDLSNGTNGAS
jgi:WD40 repeat protein